MVYIWPLENLYKIYSEILIKFQCRPDNKNNTNNNKLSQNANYAS